LLALYSQGLALDVKRLDKFIHKMEGVSGAFIRELLRKAAMFAAIESSGSLVVSDQHLDEAFSELLVAGGTLTQSLLGARHLQDG
jgi:ATP-dependent 26S proteasome regulatory subunit